MSYKVSLLCAHGVSEGGLLPCHTPTIYVTAFGAAFPRVVPALGSTLGHLILLKPGSHALQGLHYTKVIGASLYNKVLMLPSLPRQ
jgi:hypothetical protein